MTTDDKAAAAPGHTSAHEHYLEAERLLAEAEAGGPVADRKLAAAGVHAALATVGVTVLGGAVIGKSKAAWDKIMEIPRDPFAGSGQQHRGSDGSA